MCRPGDDKAEFNQQESTGHECQVSGQRLLVAAVTRLFMQIKMDKKDGRGWNWSELRLVMAVMALVMTGASSVRRPTLHDCNFDDLMAFSTRPKSENVDPFELERLAEELEFREQSKSAKPRDSDRNDTDVVEDDSDVPNLPAYIPLSHDNRYLNVEDYDVEKFLLSRSYTSLPDLRAELREYLASLKEELVKLINDDYEAFISLSTDLRDEGARLERLKMPLDGIRGRIMVRSPPHSCHIQCN